MDVRLQTAVLRRAIIAILFWLLAVSSAAAEKSDWRSWPTGDRLQISVGAFFPNIDTKVSARSASNPAGAKVDFESDLGLSDSETRPVAGLAWRFAKRHKLKLSYFDLKRSGDTVSTVRIRFGDVDIKVGVPVQSFFDVEVLEANYNYSILFSRKLEFAVGIGLSVQDIDTGIRADDGTIISSQNLKMTAPLPTLNAFFSYAFTDDWISHANIGWLAVEADISDSTDFEGSIWNSSLGVRYKAFDNVSFDLSWGIFDVDMDYFKRDLIGTLDYNYHGPAFSIQGYY